NWCKDICSRLYSCATNQPCGCSGDSCDCVQPSADCPAECEQEMARFTRGNDACAAAGESYKSCLDGSTCQDLYDGVCMVSDRDERLCPRIKDNSTPPDAPTARGSGRIGWHEHGWTGCQLYRGVRIGWQRIWGRLFFTHV